MLKGFVTGDVTYLLRLCYGSNLNFAPILPMCYGCYGSRGGKGVYPPGRCSRIQQEEAEITKDSIFFSVGLCLLLLECLECLHEFAPGRIKRSIGFVCRTFPDPPGSRLVWQAYLNPRP